MIESSYPQIKKLMNDYSEDSKLIRSDREIISQYPKIFVLSVVSLFEQTIKNKLENLIDHPAISLSSFSSLNTLIRKNPTKYVDKVYAKLEAYQDNSGSQVLNATNFYNLFGGSPFSTEIEAEFEKEKAKQIQSYELMMAKLEPLCDSDDKIFEKYSELDDIKILLNRSSFHSAEQSFLILKFKRNFIAHNYLDVNNDSFEDLKKIYYDAALYAISLSNVLRIKSTI